MKPNLYNLFKIFTEAEADARYHGCGNGWIQVEKDTYHVVEMSYSDDPEIIEREQNIDMCDDAGKVLKETDTHIWYRANFSCGEACLF